MKNKKLLFALLLLFISINAFPQTAPNLSTWASGFYNTTVKPLFPYIIGTVFIVTALFNIGELTGDNKNYKSFFTKIGLFVGGTATVMLIANWLSAQSI